MDNIEVSGNLEELKNYDIFFKYVIIVINIFIYTFGEKVMKKIDLYIDNATKDSGYTPITTVILKKYIIIKLCISDFSKKEQIVFQFAHELCHYVFYSLNGLEKQIASKEEENICTAMSLVLIKILFPNDIDYWLEYVSNLSNELYRDGVKIANQVDFKITKLKDIIYQLCKQN